ncbi:Panacea domain-containing protein [Muricauda amoyensis]|uniref:Panacea domain-containing protein n=1 Tax=Flagellimonas amoyensis TaxID=2169401 RepID=UPI00131F43DA|nr:Panacea domain-containing protein [Allomuricauda amoyensis]
MAYSKSEIDKLGNTLIYLCKNIGEPISKTKAIKLLYFIEEFSIKKYGKPFLGLEWEVWHLGPVAEDLYAEINDPFMLSDFIETTALKGYEGNFICAKGEFNDDEFSNSDIELLNLLIEKLGSKTASELIELTHRPHTLWYKLSKENNLLESFSKKTMTTTDIKIDLSNLLSDDKKEIFLNYLEQRDIKRIYGY